MRTAIVSGLLALTALTGPAGAQQPSPFAIDVPSWFVETLLDFREDIRDAAQQGRRLIVYFGQDGCPYCRQLMVTNFSQRAIVEKTRRHFVAIALNIRGDREVTWVDGRVMSEKALARALEVQFTPTLLFLDEGGKVAARINGYYPPHRFEAVLDYASGKLERREPLGVYLVRVTKESGSATLIDEPFFMPAPNDLRRLPGGKPLAVVIETPYCVGCDELHREGFQHPEVRALLARLDVARIELGARSPMTTPDGRQATTDEWVRELNITYTPAVVFFDARGVEVFRVDSYLRPFHLASALDYVASAAYRDEPSFQHYLQARAASLRARGERVDLWQ
jgi:thioredoxin-related protein